MNFLWSGLSSTLDLKTVCLWTLPDPALVQVEAGNRALKAVFGSKLAAKGKSLAELLQPHSIGKRLFLCLKNIASENIMFEVNMKKIYLMFNIGKGN